MRFFLTIVLSVFLAACSGYRLGGQKPAKLAAVEKIHVPLARSEAFFPRAEALLTNSMVAALVRDGTYRLGTADDSDAVLRLELRPLDYRAIRSGRENSLRSEELEVQAQVRWRLEKPGQLELLEEGVATGRSRFFVDTNLQTARRNALPDAFLEVAQDITGRLADGF